MRVARKVCRIVGKAAGLSDGDAGLRLGEIVADAAQQARRIEPERIVHDGGQ